MSDHLSAFAPHPPRPALLLPVLVAGMILVGCASSPASPTAAIPTTVAPTPAPTASPVPADTPMATLTPRAASTVASTTTAGASTTAVASSGSVLLTGFVDKPGALTLAALQQLPTKTETISYQTGTGVQTHTVEGVLLYTALSQAGLSLDPKIKNDQLRKLVVLTANDGYELVVALGDLDPNLGNRQVLLAWKQDGQPLTGSQGPLRLAIPGDKLGARQIFGLTKIEVRDVDSSLSPGATPVGSLLPNVIPTLVAQSSGLTVNGLVDKPSTLTVADLQKLPTESVSVSFQGPQGIEQHTFQGVRLEAVLNQAGVTLDSKIKYDQLRKYVLATGEDGYEAAIDLGAIDPSFGNEPILVAWSQDGKPLAGPAGPVRLVTPGDGHGARYVSGLIRLEVRDVDSPPHTH